MQNYYANTKTRDRAGSVNPAGSSFDQQNSLMVQNGGRPRRLSNGITVQNGLQKGLQSQPASSRNSLVVNNGHLHPGYLPKRSSSPRLTVPVNGKASERRYIILVITY